MKKYLAFAILALVASACSKESKVSEEKQPNESGLPVITVDIAEPSVRVALGTEGEGVYPLVWNAGDCITVSQTSPAKSAVFRLKGDGGSASGSFEYLSGDSDIEAFNDVVYPAGSNGQIPTSQAYAAGTFDPSAAVMGYHNDVAVALGGSVSLSHKASFICLPVIGKSGQSVKSITAKIGDKDYTLSCASPVALSETAVPFYIAVDAAASVNATFTLVLGDDKTVKKASLDKTFQTGYLHRFKASKVIDRGDLFEGGFVYQTDTDYNWVVVMSLDEISLAFSTESVSIGTEGNPEEGAANTALIAGMANYPGAYPATKWCLDHGEGWYMPSRKELSRIWNNLFSAVEVSGVTSIGKDRAQGLLTHFGGATMQMDVYYQSCCESSATKMHHIKMNAQKTVYQQNKTASRFVRAVKKITI